MLRWQYGWLLTTVACGGTVTTTAPDASVDGSADSAVDVTDTGPTLADACREWARGVCATYAENLFLRSLHADAARCQVEQQTLCLHDAALPGVVDAIGFLGRCHPPAAGRSEFALSCGDRPGVVRGTLTDGTACNVDEQCASGNCEHVLLGVFSPCGKCRDNGRPGIKCAADGVDCWHDPRLGRGDGYVCDPETHVCREFTADGDPCITKDVCASGRCEGGRCAARIDDGAPAGASCAAKYCDQKSVCVAGVCQALPLAVSALCPYEGLGDCVAGTVCRKVEGEPEFRCLTPRPLGASCSNRPWECGLLAHCGGKPLVCTAGPLTCGD
ncbi:MAG: hypothetical protein JNL79_15745 [Myxococcales bacterium]|nr:hypothetical protein [Myxococcales bacterium]